MKLRAVGNPCSQFPGLWRPLQSNFALLTIDLSKLLLLSHDLLLDLVVDLC
jgi:hypothetical protein